MKPSLNAWPANPNIPDFLPEMDQTMPLAVQLALNLMTKGERVYIKVVPHNAELLTAASVLAAASVVPAADNPRGSILFNTFRLNSPGNFAFNYEQVEAEADLVKIGGCWTLIPLKEYA